MATQPLLMSVPFANAGAKNTIPQNTTTLGKASLVNGFPTETSMPIDDGGVPPQRADFNGMLYWLSTFAMFQQSGGKFSYDASINYDVPSIIYHNGDLWWCLQSNGPATIVKAPGSDANYWIKFKNYISNPLDAYPVGSYYISSVSTSPATLFGGTWVQVQDRMILAAGTKYSAGTLENPATGGSETKLLTIQNIPSHTHTFTTSSAGNHTHTVSGSTQSAGAHTHGVSGTTGGAGTHSHTRGTMNITGGIDGRSQGTSIEAFGETTTSASVTGAFVGLYGTQDSVADGGGAYNMLRGFSFDASRSWTGSTSTAANHTHSFSATSGSAGSHTHTISITVGQAGAHTHSGTTGGTGNGTAFNVMNPYIVAYVWRRTA